MANSRRPQTSQSSTEPSKTCPNQLTSNHLWAGVRKPSKTDPNRIISGMFGPGLLQEARHSAGRPFYASWRGKMAVFGPGPETVQNVFKSDNFE